MTTPRLGAPELTGSQTNKEETVNEIVRYLEQGACLFRPEDRDLDAAPASPSDGQCYLIDGTPAGGDLWEGHGGDLTFYMNTEWVFIAPRPGWILYFKDEDAYAYTPDGSTWIPLAIGSSNPTESLIIACGDELTPIETGAGKVTFRMPYAFTLSAVRASVTTAPTGSTIIIDINEGGTTILSTKLSIDATEKTSTTAASAAVISDTTLADDAEITIDFDQVGSTIAGSGVKVYLIGSRT